MSRTKSVSDAWAVNAAKPITNATAVGATFRVRVSGLSEVPVGISSGLALSCDGLSFFMTNRSRFVQRFFVKLLSLNGPYPPGESPGFEVLVYSIRRGKAN